MNKKILFFLCIITISICFIIIKTNTKDQFPAPTIYNKNNKVSNNTEKNNLIPKKELRVKSFNIHSKINKNISPQTLKKQRISHLKKTFKKLHAVSANIFYEQSLKLNLEDLASDYKNIEIAKDTILDLNFAIENFGKDQSIARVFSIELIKFEALNNDKDQIQDIIQKLSTHLCQSEVIKKGQDKDLIDLLIVYISIHSEAIFKHSYMNLDALGYCHKNNSLFAQGVFEGATGGTSSKIIKEFISKTFHIEYLI